MSLTQNRNFEATEPVWAQAKAAHQRLIENFRAAHSMLSFKWSHGRASSAIKMSMSPKLLQPQSPNLPSVSRLFQMMRALAQETDTERLLHRILDSVVMLSGAERGLLILADKDDQTLSARATSESMKLKMRHGHLVQPSRNEPSKHYNPFEVETSKPTAASTATIPSTCSAFRVHSVYQCTHRHMSKVRSISITE